MTTSLPTSKSYSTFQWASIFLAVAVTAGTTLCLQLIQTRILSSLYYNHLVYLTVTVALLGFGMSGTLVTIVAPKVRSPEKLASWGLLGFSLSMPVCLGLTSYLPVLLEFSNVLVRLLLSYLLLTVPFVFAGVTLASIFMLGGRLMHRLYFCDLAASALGTIIFVLLLTPMTAGGLLWACSFATMIAFGVITCALNLDRRALVLSLPLLVLYFSVQDRLLGDTPDYPKIGCKGKDCKVFQTRWTPITKIDVVSSSEYKTNMGLDVIKPMDTLTIGQDRDAPTVISPAELVRTRLKFAKATPPLVLCEGINFLIHPNPEEALIIGVGGGTDVVSAMAAGAKHITGIEINQVTIDLMKTTYADYALWPKLANIELLCMDGRNYAARTKKKFDTINMTGIDTFSALSTGAYVLSENYLYTVEAIRDYLRILKDDGILNIFRWNFRTARESLRLCNLFIAASLENGNQHPEKCIMVIGVGEGRGLNKGAYRWASNLMKKKPFTQEEVRRVLNHIESNPPVRLAVIYLPKVFEKAEQEYLEQKFFANDHEYYSPNRKAYEALINSPSQESRKQFEISYPYKITPVYDDCPFFFEYHKMSELFDNRTEPNGFGPRSYIVHYTLYFLLIVTALISYLGIIVPLKFFSKDGLQVPAAKSLIFLFSSLGLGFMFVELGVIQMLNVYLGHPMYSLGVVLAGLLFFTGLGSYLAGKVNLPLSKLVERGMVGSSLVILLWTLVMPAIISGTAGEDLIVRVLISLVSLLPLGLLMGIPFATGIRYLSEGKERFIPWAWGVNGLTSVMASILAILLAMRIGFRALLVVAAITYAVGYFAAKKSIGSSSASV
jgi:SAM-dependent methyltransferase